MSIPLVGGKLEGLIGDLLQSALRTEERSARLWRGRRPRGESRRGAADHAERQEGSRGARPRRARGRQATPRWQAPRGATRGEISSPGQRPHRAGAGPPHPLPLGGNGGPSGVVECMHIRSLDDMAPMTISASPPSWDLPNRLVMAPLTRNRATEGMVPGDLAVEYYRQRATAGLIISEGTQPAVGQGYLAHPGHPHPRAGSRLAPRRRRRARRGGRIVVQLMHAGRVAHPDNKDGLESVAPSALARPNQMFTAEGPKPHPVPRALETDEIPGIVEDFVQGGALRGRGRPRRGRIARRERLPAAPVPGAGLQRAHGRVRRQPGQPGPPPSRWPAPSPRRSAPERVGIRISPRTTSRARPRRTRPTSRRRTARSSRASPRSAWPTSACWPTRPSTSSSGCARTSAVC